MKAETKNEGLRDCEIAARDLRAIIDALTEKTGLTMRCAPLLTREGWSEGDKGAQHRQCVLEHPAGVNRRAFSMVATYSAGSAIPIQWIESASKATKPGYRHLSGWQGLAWQYREAVRNDGPQWSRKAMYQDLVQRIRAAWNPDLFDVLAALLMDSPGTSETFEEWASNYGYDEDSRKAEATFRECRRIGKEMRILFGPDFERARELAGQL